MERCREGENRRIRIGRVRLIPNIEVVFGFDSVLGIKL